MKKSKSSGLISQKTILDAAEAAHRLRLLRVLQQEINNIQSFEVQATQTLEQATKFLHSAVTQQGVDLLCTLRFQCEGKICAIKTLMQKLGKCKRLDDVQNVLKSAAEREKLVNTVLWERTKEFKLRDWVECEVGWSDQDLNGKTLKREVVQEIAELSSETTQEAVGRLDLSGKGVSAGELRGLNEITHMYPRVKELDLSSSELTETATIELGKCVNRFPQLETLILKGNTLTASGVRILALTSGLCRNLHHLDLEENLLGRTLPSLGNCLSTSFPALSVLSLKHNSLRDSDLSALSKDLPQLLCLQKLDFSTNLLTGIGVKSFCLVVPHLPILSKIDFSDNRLGDDAGQYLANALSYATKLTYLGLSYNHLTTKSLCSLAESASELLWLEEVNLEGNEIARNAGERLTSSGRKVMRL